MPLQMEHVDALYGKFNIPGEIAQIIRSSLFQRLKRIKQLGLLVCTVPQAKVTRYDHCIGTYYRAQQMLLCLDRNTPWIDDNNRLPRVYRLAVFIAALLHDIGHGPFSHTWEHVNEQYHHEHNALPCIDAIFAELNENSLKEMRENNNHGIEVIKALILGDASLPTKPVSKRYRFIFEIVNNHACKLDVDKWDYLKRDFLYLETFCPQLNMDFDDVFLKARISRDGSHIEYRYNDYHKIYRIFEARWKLHISCYQMPKSIACNYILKLILSRYNLTYVMSMDAKNVKEFVHFDDECIWKLLQSDELYNYLKDTNRIEHIACKCDNICVENYSNNKLGFFLKAEVKGPGEEMPNDETFFFYGDPSQKHAIERNFAPTDCGGYFRLL